MDYLLATQLVLCLGALTLLLIMSIRPVRLCILVQASSSRLLNDLYERRLFVELFLILTSIPIGVMVPVTCIIR